MVGNIQARREKSFGEKMRKNTDMRKNQLQTRMLDANPNTRTGRTARFIGGMSARRDAKQAAAKKNLGIAQIDYIADKSVTDTPVYNEQGEKVGTKKALTSFGQSVAGGALATERTSSATLGNALNAQRQLEIEEVKAAHASIENIDDSALKELAKNGSSNDPRTAAALERLAKISQTDFMEAANKHVSSGPSAASRAAAGAASSFGYYGGGQIEAMAQGKSGDLKNTAIDSIAGGGLSPAEIASASSETHKTINAMKQELRMNGDARHAAYDQRLRDAAGRMTEEQKNRMNEKNLNLYK